MFSLLKCWWTFSLESPTSNKLQLVRLEKEIPLSTEERFITIASSISNPVYVNMEIQALKPFGKPSNFNPSCIVLFRTIETCGANKK